MWANQIAMGILQIWVIKLKTPFTGLEIKRANEIHYYLKLANNENQSLNKKACYNLRTINPHLVRLKSKKIDKK